MTKKDKGLEKRISELEQGWRRTQADFDNYKKKSEQEKRQWIEVARSEALSELLPILDNLYFAISSTPENLKDDSWVTGLRHIIKQVEDKLEELGISRINPSEGQDFDPNYHEAIQTLPTKEFGPDRIIKTQRAGYKTQEKILRPAQVIVSK